MSERGRTYRWIDAVAASLRFGVGGLLIFMVALNGANAFGRFVLNQSIIGADEVMVFCMIWLVFLGAAEASWRRKHLSIDLLRPRLPGAVQHWLLVLRGLMLAFVCVFVSVQSLSVIEQLGRIGQRSMAAEIPMTIPHTAIVVGLGLAALFALMQIFIAPTEDDPPDRPDRERPLSFRRRKGPLRVGADPRRRRSGRSPR